MYMTEKKKRLLEWCLSRKERFRISEAVAKFKYEYCYAGIYQALMTLSKAGFLSVHYEKIPGLQGQPRAFFESLVSNKDVINLPRRHIREMSNDMIENRNQKAIITYYGKDAGVYIPMNEYLEMTT